MKSFKEFLTVEGRNYHDNRTGFAQRRREDDEYHNEPKPKFKPKDSMSRPHTVHIDGKPWKKFDNGHLAHAAANTLKAKGKKAVAIAHFNEDAGVAINAVSAGNVQGIGFGPKGEPGGRKAVLNKQLLKRRSPNVDT